MNRRFYSLYLYLLAPAIWLYFIYRGFKDKRYFSGLFQRLGFGCLNRSSSSIHIHCASVGEAIAAAPLIERLVTLYPNDFFVLTSTTPTGREQLQKIIASLELDAHRVQHCYLPIDWAGSCKRFIRKINPRISILIETELWPNFLHFLKQQEVPVLLVNARMSDKSLAKYQQKPQLSQSIFSNISIVAAQYQSDGDKFLKLGVADEQLKITGSIKFDVHLSESLKKEQQRLKAQWIGERPSWIAASIHPGEFDAVLTAHKKLLEQFPQLLLVAVARHPEQFLALKKLAEDHSLNVVCRSTDNQVQQNHHVLIVDSMGEMTLMCGIVDLAFVGGSLIDRGGHNPIEPAVCGLPVLMGPSRFNFTDVCMRMEQSKVLINVADTKSLSNTIERLLLSPKQLAEYSQNAESLFEKNGGAVDRLTQLVANLIKPL